MLTTANRLPRLLALLAVTPVMVEVAPAQVPEGAAVVCTYTEKAGDYSPGTPGLFIVPLTGAPVAPIRITGLPAFLTTDGGGAYRQGAMSVSLRSSDGAVIVGTVGDSSAPSAGQVSLYVFHLNGSAVATTQHIVLGTTTDLAYVWTAVAPDGRIVVTASEGQGPLLSGPMAFHQTAIVDTTTPAPTFQLLPNPVGLINPASPSALGGAALDPTGDFSYVLLSDFPGTLNSVYAGPNHAKLYRFVLATQAWCQIADWPGESAFGVTCDDDGSVYVSATNPTSGAHYIHTVTPNGCNPATVSTVQTFTTATPPPGMPGELLAWGLAQDRANGWLVAPSYDNRPGFAGAYLNTLSLIDPASGFAWVAATPPVVGWGTIGRQGHGVAVNNAVESYGAASPGANSYWFDNFPNPGGLPTLGNLGFSLTTKSLPAAPLLSVLALSFGRSSTSVLGIELLIDPATAVIVGLPGSLPSTFPLPIPNVVGLTGQEVTAQSVHLEANGGFAASRGLSVAL